MLEELMLLELVGLSSLSSLSKKLSHPGSSGKSMRPSPSLSVSSKHCATACELVLEEIELTLEEELLTGALNSSLSKKLSQPGSFGKSMRPSPSLSRPS